MKKNDCIWQGHEGTRAQGYISKWAVTDWKSLAQFKFSMKWRKGEGGVCTHFSLAIPSEVFYLPGNSLSC